jgi:hypothetical protein
MGSSNDHLIVASCGEILAERKENTRDEERKCTCFGKARKNLSSKTNLFVHQKSDRSIPQQVDSHVQDSPSPRRRRDSNPLFASDPTTPDDTFDDTDSVNDSTQSTAYQLHFHDPRTCFSTSRPRKQMQESALHQRFVNQYLPRDLAPTGPLTRTQSISPSSPDICSG